MLAVKKLKFIEPQERPKGLSVWAPITGQVHALDSLPDPIFEQNMLGEGVAIELTGNTIVAPFNGRVSEVSPCCERIKFQSEKGIKLAIFMPEGTQSLMGTGFKLLVKEREKVVVGQPLIQFDIRHIQNACSSLLCPVIITNSEKVGAIFQEKHYVTAGEDYLFTITPQKTATAKKSA